MKIGIVTLPLHINYGGILQAYALQTVLEHLGHQTEILQVQRPRKLPYYRMPQAYAKRFIKKFVLGHSETRFFEEQWWNKEGIPAMRKCTDQFLNKHLHLRHMHSIKEVQPTDYDGYVVGSDQVWRKIYFSSMMHTSICDAFLRFAKDWKVKRIAYAASFGTDTWEYTDKETFLCGVLLQQFDAVTVREASAVELCKKKFDVDATHVLDPTMLLTAHDYQVLFEEEKTPKSEGNMHCYILNRKPEKQALIDEIARERDLCPFSVLNPIQAQVKDAAELTQPPAEQWLRAFYDSEFVVTDSFHACVFSILFRKQFVVYGNESRGMARFHILLSAFGLEDRLVSNYEQYKELTPIDYDTVYEKLDIWRPWSLEELKKSTCTINI